MSLMPALFSVAAVVTMIEIAIKFESHPGHRQPRSRALARGR